MSCLPPRYRLDACHSSRVFASRAGDAGSNELMLDLPRGITTCLFDLDGVLTQTAKIHAQAWKQMFDDFLRDWSERTGAPFEPFDRPTDYDEYVDGKPRLDGVHSFLQSRGIDIPMGSPSDPPEEDTVHALGTRKNNLVLDLIQDQGVEPYAGSVAFVQRARDQGLRRAVVSSSTNCLEVLVAAGIEHLFEVRIDGTVAEREGLAGKPAPDTFLAGARAFDADPAQAAVFEDAQAGVQAGRAGDFGWVVGVDRTGQAEALRQRGADVVVEDLAELLERR
jgi:beta-phosphoglucomutase family hydrolase